VTFSIPTLDPDIWRRTELGTAPPRQRLRAIRTLVDAGIKTSVGMAPILPGISDRPELMADVIRATRDAGAVSIWANVLYLRPGTREHFLDHLARDWPELLPMYERLYLDRAYLPNAIVGPVRHRVRELADAAGIDDRRAIRLEPAPEPVIEQLPLAAFIQAPGQLAATATGSDARPV
jgi:DNA repair photolyase